jgi:UDP-N-acetylmuramoylalanine-D-glutamate ligase
VAVFLNITTNHLDSTGHAGLRRGESRILNYQHLGCVAVLNRDDEGSWELATSRRAID